MYQEGSPYEPYFIAVNNWGQAVIGPTKKIVATHVIGELKVLIWFQSIDLIHVDMKAEQEHVIINASCIQYGLGYRMITIWLAMLK